MPKTSPEESKFTVASILSSMANGTQFTVPGPAYENAVTPTTVSTATTPLLTPTTLANLEQTFIELSSVQSQASQSNVTNVVELHPSNQVTHRDVHRIQSGFVPPIVQQADYSDESSNDQDWYTPPAKRVHSEQTYSVNGSAILIA